MLELYMLVYQNNILTPRVNACVWNLHLKSSVVNIMF